MYETCQSVKNYFFGHRQICCIRSIQYRFVAGLQAFLCVGFTTVSDSMAEQVAL